METTLEPLDGLIEFMAWNEAGNGIARFRFYSLEPHGYGNGHIAGRFADGIYTCAMADGTKFIEADGANGIGVTVFDKAGAPSLSFRTVGPGSGRCEIEAASGKRFAWHPNGRPALIATFSQAMYDAWNMETRVAPRAALSPLTHASLKAYVEPWLQGGFPPQSRQGAHRRGERSGGARRQRDGRGGHPVTHGPFGSPSTSTRHCCVSC